MYITPKHNKKKLLFFLLPFLLLVAGVTALAITQDRWLLESNKKAENKAVNADGINYSPPSDLEVSSGQEAKRDNDRQQAGNGSIDQAIGRQEVAVGVAFADYDSAENAIDVRAFTPSVIENDGQCAATFTKDDFSVVQTSKAFVDFSSTQCEPILIGVSKFNIPGIWKLTVSYNSSKSTGVSPAMDIEINQ